jgi:hypothetical protein
LIRVEKTIKVIPSIMEKQAHVFKTEGAPLFLSGCGREKILLGESAKRTNVATQLARIDAAGSLESHVLMPRKVKISQMGTNGETMSTPSTR